MATTIPYSSRDFESILTAMRANLRTAMPGINDFLESNQGRYLLDQFAATAEMLGFTIDRTAAELYIDTVETRPSLASLLKLIGYQMANPKPELVQITITRDQFDVASDLVIPRYTKVVAQPGASSVIPFSTATAVVIPKGMASATTFAVQGEWKVLQYVGNGAPYQAYVLASKRVAEGYIVVWVDGNEWSRATDNTFVGHTPHDLVFRTVNLPDRRMLVEFGGEGEGFPPPNGRQIQIRYMDTLGPRGHIDAGQIASVSGIAGTVAGLIATNDEPSTGGIDFELIETAEARYPIVFRAMRRAVTLEDFEALAREVPGVMQARAVDRNIDPTLPFMVVRLYVIGEGGFVSESLNRVTFDVLRQRRVNAQRFEVWSPDEQNVAVTGQVRAWRQFNATEVIANVTSRVKDFFLMTSLPDCEVKLGQAVSLSRLIAAIQDVEGVASVNLTSPIGDLAVDANEFVRLDSVSLTLAGIV